MCAPGGDTGFTPAKASPVAWQFEQPFTIPAWFIGAGSQACVEWQVSQARPVGMWDPGCAVARAPLWHVAQPPGVTPAWSNLTVTHVNVLWQVSHEAEVTRWPEGFPVAVVPLWQVAHVPGTTPEWSNCAPAKDSVLWHTEHSWTTGGCDDVITTVLIRALAVWQPVQVFGVFLNSPRTWQLSHRVRSCAPVSGNPVVQCSATASGPGGVETRFCVAGGRAAGVCPNAGAAASAAPTAAPSTNRRSHGIRSARVTYLVIGVFPSPEARPRVPVATACASRRHGCP